MEVEEFSALFERFERSAFRVEARDRYEVDHEREAVAAFLEGQEFAASNRCQRSLARTRSGPRSRRRVIERVRIVSEPPTEYTRFELAAYRDNIAAGEKVRVIPRAALADADQGWASEDFWIFDEKLVVLLSYDDKGRFLGVQQLKDIRSYLEAKQRALSLTVDSMPSSPSSNLEKFPACCVRSREAGRPQVQSVTRRRTAERETCLCPRTGGRVASARRLRVW